jgi:AAA domain
VPGKRNLPVLTKVQLQSFSLYRNHRSIDISVRPGVFCLAGANGLGKSSFLAAVNFAYTGIVASPRRSFRLVNDYYSDSLAYSRRYFDGRIEQEDRPEANVTLSFRIGTHGYQITRNLFEPEALRGLSIVDENGTNILDASNFDPAQRHVLYKNRIVEDCNLPSFEYFVFMQHFLLTFDERRHALFWDDRAANVALYLAFGVEPEDTITAERLRREIDSADSNARNAQWQATLARNRLNAVAGKDVPGLQELREAHERLIQRADDAREEVDLAQRAVQDAELKAAEESARHLALRREYDSVFSKRLVSHRDPAMHPTVRLSLAQHICDICGTESEEAMGAIEAALASHVCPLCSSPIQPSDEDVDVNELQQVDDDLAAAKMAVETAQARLDRLRADASRISQTAADTAEELSNFESSNSEQMSALLSSGPEIAQQRRELESEYRRAVERRDEHRGRRDALRDELDPLLSAFTAAYQEGETQFVPRFRRLAKRFIGLDLDVGLYQQKGTYGLTLEVQGERRRETTELSESQRFFLDIALRMALAQHMSEHDSPAGLMVDTPEGSLDIAYEARAGDMFADFVHDGFNLVMTANINSSQLLIRLAERCGTDLMQLVRMTEWTPLTEVQAEEEDLFNRAYQQIETELANTPRYDSSAAQ